MRSHSGRRGVPMAALLAAAVLPLAGALAGEPVPAEGKEAPREVMPETNVITLADWIHIVSFAAIFTVIAQSTVSLWAAETKREGLSRRLDRVFCAAVPAAYLAANVLLVALR
jgi:hypothetical protein